MAGAQGDAQVGTFAVRAVDVALTRELRQAVLRPHLDVAQMTASEPPGAFAVGAFDGDRLVAVGLIGIDGGERWRIRGMATDPSDRGRGAGGMVLDALIAHARAHGATRIWCNARVPARRSYERAGFGCVSAAFELHRIGPHVVMELC
jgi:GNAT superfamily N-acetyltransferase